MFYMKSLLVLTAAATFFSAHGDVILTGYHQVQRCAIVSNISQFPDIVLFAAYKQTMSSQTPERYVIEENKCLEKGYKFCPFYVFWAEKGYFESVGLNNLPIEDYLAVKKTNENNIQPVRAIPFSIISTSIEPLGSQVPDSDLTISENLEYKLIPTATGKTYTLYLASKTTHYNNGKDTVIEYPYGVSVMDDKRQSNKQPQFMKATFGRGCLLISSFHTGNISAQLIDCRGSVVNKFTRSIKEGKYYTIPCAGVSAGMYWLRVKNEVKEMTLPLTILGGL